MLTDGKPARDGAGAGGKGGGGRVGNAGGGVSRIVSLFGAESSLAKAGVGMSNILIAVSAIGVNLLLTGSLAKSSLTSLLDLSRADSLRSLPAGTAEGINASP